MQRTSVRRARSHLGTVGMTAAAVAAAAVAVPALAQGRSAADLMTVRGELTACGDVHCVSGRVVSFGPAAALRQVAAVHDFDRDGATGSLAEEVAGLVGTDVVLEVVHHDGGADEVHNVGGLPYRDKGEPAPGTDPDVQRPPADGGSTTGGRHDGVTLHEISGTLERCGTDYCVGGEVVDFAPLWYLNSTSAGQDYDGDGVVGTLADEIAGLVGTSVDIQAEAGRFPDVHFLNGAHYRGGGDSPPAWAGGPFATEKPGPPADLPSGAPAWAGRPDGVGPPSHAGRPDHAGRPEGVGKPEGVGPPGEAGPPEGAGRPADAGPPEGAGRSKGAGRPADAGGPPDGPPEGSGPPPGAGGFGEDRPAAPNR
jgi:hypothetical protein